MDAFCFSWNSLHNISQIYCFLLYLSIFLFCTTLEASAAPLSFSFPGFDSNHPFIYTERNATVSTDGIELTTNKRDYDQRESVGRATYTEPLHLWDKASGNQTNFTTRFSFIINSNENEIYGDGLAFFLAPNGSRLPPNVIAGGGLGLAVNEAHALNYSENHFVAVEFDTYYNNWDPNYSFGYDHVGINIRSMNSAATMPWLSGAKHGSRTYASIIYDSRNKILDVVVASDQFGHTNVQRPLSTAVDLAMHLPEWVTFGFSASTGQLSEIHRITSWEFNSSSDIIDDPGVGYNVSNPNYTAPPPPQLPATMRKLEKKNKVKAGLVAGLSVVIGALIITGVGLVSFCFRKKQREEKTSDPFPIIDVSFDGDNNGIGPRKFSHNELANATNNFSERHKLGEGGFGAVYKGFLKQLNSYVAVKRVSRKSKQGIKEYMAEVKIISRLRHRNLVKLIGWCHEKELLLAYEFMPNGSLDSHLYKGKSLLTWELRYRIAQGLASALLYLHEEGDQCVLHRDIKSSNIMLDTNFEAKLGDFGLARLVDHSKGCETTILAGTMGYMAPECFTTGKASKESDIYSFGVVCLEIGCGRRVVEPKLEDHAARIIEWVWELYGKGKILEAADKKLCGDLNQQEMERLLVVGLWCVHPDSKFRPSIRQVTNMLLDSEAPPPNIPAEMPVPAYLAPPTAQPSEFLVSSYCTSNNREGKMNTTDSSIH